MLADKWVVAKSGTKWVILDFVGALENSFLSN